MTEEFTSDPQTTHSGAARIAALPTLGLPPGRPLAHVSGRGPTQEAVITPAIDHGPGRSTQAPHREAIGKRVILVVEDDWRTRHFIGAVLKYSVNALAIESSSPRDALVLARKLECRIDLPISNIDLADAKTGMDAARESQLCGSLDPK
jgi:hypothetical protein